MGLIPDGVTADLHMDYENYFSAALDRLHRERRYRTFADLERVVGRFPYAIWYSRQGKREITMWCSNDYLAMRNILR